jgi:hypothetical protein
VVTFQYSGALRDKINGQNFAGENFGEGCPIKTSSNVPGL